MNSLRFLILASVIVFLVNFSCSRGDQQRMKKNTPQTATEEKSSEGKILALGDSLTEGYRVDSTAAYPAQLADRLQDMGYNYQVINAGVSGETSSGARSRLDWSLKVEPDIVILETGANDGLRGTSPDLTYRNIAAMIETLRAKDIIVILAGMKMVSNLGAQFSAEFANIYPKLAKQYDVYFIPFILEGVARVPELNTADGIHPNEKGYGKIVENMLPVVLEAVKAHQAALP